MDGLELVGFVGVSDLEVAGRFYGEVLGLESAGVSPYAAVFDVGGTQLRVTLVHDVAPVPYTVLGWKVADVTAAVRDLRERGVELLRPAGLEQDADDIWTAPGGARIAWFHDPDGNTLSLQEEPS